MHRKVVHMGEKEDINLGDRLRMLRQQKNLRQEQVADLISVSKKAVSSYELGTRQPSYEILIRFANLYRVTTDYLLGNSSKKMIDASGLTNSEYTMVLDFVSVLTEKNKQLEVL